MAKHHTHEDEVILEPGDPGYEEPTPAPEPEPEPAPPGKDVTPPRLPAETDAEYESRTRHMVVVSESPTDIVPNRANITIAPPPPAPEEASA